METYSIPLIHYWKGQISSDKLQAFLDQYAKLNFKVWCILLDEKLRRNETSDNS